MKKEATKRNSTYTIAMEEIEGCIASPDTVEVEVEAKEFLEIPSIRLKARVAVACLILAATALFMVNQLFRKDADLRIEVAKPAADSPAGMRKFVNYNGRRYIFKMGGLTTRLSIFRITLTPPVFRKQ